MLARVVLLGLAASVAGATVDIAFDCSDNDGSTGLAGDAVAVAEGEAFVRVGADGTYTDYWVSCDAGATMINGITQDTLAIEQDTLVTIANRAKLGFEIATVCTDPTTAQTCQFTTVAGTDLDVLLVTTATRNTLYDCAKLTMPTSGFLFEKEVGKTMGLEADKFTCSKDAVALVPTALTGAFKSTTEVGFFGVPNGAADDTFILASDGVNNLFVEVPVNKVLSSDASTTCTVPTDLITTEGCEIMDGTVGAFNAVFQGGAVAAAKVAEVVPCTFKCTSVGNVAGAGCTSSSSTSTASLCQGQATTVVTTPCVEGRAQGEVFCFPKATAVNFAQADFDAVVAAFVTAPNSNAAFFSFIGVLRAQAFTFAFGTTCVACVVETLSSGGFILCVDCGVLLAGSAAARQGTGVRVVICGTAGNTEAERTACLEAAACAGALESAACFRAGVAVPCPVCTANLETTSSSKKGLLGLLGLLAIIPAVLLLCSSILCCCLLLRRRKRAVPPPVIPTVAPMTSVCEPVVCGGTIGAAPMGCSPYGSAYPVM